MSTTTDEALMQRVGAGDPAALDQLFRRHHARVHALCVRLTGDARTADDLVQETFLRVLRYARGFNARARFSTWLYRIARNACLDHLKREQRAQAAHERLDPPSEVAERSTESELLERALAALPLPLRETLVLSRLHDLPCAEVAAILKCSEGAVRTRVHRALAELRRLARELEKA